MAASFSITRTPCQEALGDESRQLVLGPPLAPATERRKVVGLLLLHEMPNNGHSSVLGAAALAEGLPVPLLPILPAICQHTRPGVNW